MSIEMHLRAAASAADKLVNSYGFGAASDIRLEDLAWDLGIEVIDDGLRGADARLIRSGNNGVIRVSDRLIHPGRRRFSIAHEIGHFQLDHINLDWLACVERDFHILQKSELKEAQANIFAAHLLLPTALIQRWCEVSPVNLKPIREIAEEFQTSITSAALRFVDLTSEPCAVFFSEAGKVKWSRKSDECFLFTKGWGQELSDYSVAYDYFAKGKTDNRPQQVDVSAWADGENTYGIEEVWEHSMPIPSINSVLTTVWIEQHR